VGLPTRLRLTELLGTGTSAAVWRARDTRDGVDVAVKLVAPRPGSALTAVRVEREARALARLGPVPGVVTLHEVGLAADATMWLVMDLVPGGSLADRLAEPAVDDPTAVRPLGAALAATLAAAHELEVVHGDLSPGNVLFDAEGRPVLADFGMSDLLGGRTEGPHGFTPAYAAPERLRGAAPSQAADVYSLAAVLWHVHAGAPPGAAPPARRDRPDAADLDRLLLAATAPDPTARPSAAELADELRRGLRRPRRARWRR